MVFASHESEAKPSQLVLDSCSDFVNRTLPTHKHTQTHKHTHKHTHKNTQKHTHTHTHTILLDCYVLFLRKTEDIVSAMRSGSLSIKLVPWRPKEPKTASGVESTRRRTPLSAVLPPAGLEAPCTSGSSRTNQLLDPGSVFSACHIWLIQERANQIQLYARPKIHHAHSARLGGGPPLRVGSRSWAPWIHQRACGSLTRADGRISSRSGGPALMCLSPHHPSEWSGPHETRGGDEATRHTLKTTTNHSAFFSPVCWSGLCASPQNKKQSKTGPRPRSFSL